MKELPGIFTLYNRVIKLYLKTFPLVLPFLLAYVLILHLINLYYPQSETEINYLNTLFIIIASTLFNSFLVFGIYQKHHQRPFSYSDTLIKGTTRFLPLLISVIIMILPMLVLLLLIVLLGRMPDEASVIKLIFALMVLASSLAIIIYAFFLLYFIVSPVSIVGKGRGPIAGLKESWSLIEGHWFKTLVLILIYFALQGLLYFGLLKLANLNPNICIEILCFFFASFYASLIVVYYDHLEIAAS